MNELLEFLTSKEIMVVYFVAGVAFLLCFIVYIIEKNTVKLKRKQNTKELNKLVDEVTCENIEESGKPIILENKELTSQPVIQSTNDASSVIELLESTKEMDKIEVSEKEEQQVVETSPLIIEEMDIVMEEDEVIKTEGDTNTLANPQLDLKPSLEQEKEELKYTSIEPDVETARQELEKITEELKKQESEQIENIALTNYEEEQEENAIISLEELVKKSKEMYEANELTQYADEGNEPISLQDLEKRMGDVKTPSYDEPFIIENIVTDALEKEELLKEDKVENTLPIQENANVINTQVILDNNISDTLTVKKFQSSPIISPIYGIEKPNNDNELELENTANYEKLDEEIKKTNEFLMTLKELQRKLD